MSYASDFTNTTRNPKNAMKIHQNAMNNTPSQWPSRCRTVALFSLLAACFSIFLPKSSAAPAPDHGIIAGNLEVVVNDFDNTTNSVTITVPYSIGDFRVPYANNGDYDIQIGSDRTDDVLNGLLISSVRENGRDNGDIIYQGLQLATSHIDYHRPGATNATGELVENSYWIPVAGTQPNSLGTAVREWDINLAAAWFPFDKWVAGFARNATGANGGDNDLLTGTPGLVLGTHFVDRFGGNGKAKVDLTSLGIDSRTDGVLMVMGAKNEDNYGLSKVNDADGTWTLYSKDNGSVDGNTEQDPLAFVFIPNSDTNVVSGRFLGDGTIAMHNGDTAKFTITPVDVGTWELKIPGASPRFGVLLLSPEGGLPGNQDNAVTYQMNLAGDGWIIQSWDLPSPVVGDGTSFPPYSAPPLETPGDGTEPVADFVFIPGATPGVTITPTKSVFTTEAGVSADISVVLDTQPTSDVTINVSSDNTAEGTVAVSSLTFTPTDWNTPKIVTVTGQDDAAEDGPVTYHVVLAAATSADADYNGLDAADAAVINLDNEAPFTVIPTSGLITTEGGGTTTFDVVLNSAPTADVVIGLSSSDTTEGTVSDSSLTFTTANWNQVRTVTVTGVDDSLDDGDVPYTIVTATAVSTDANFNGKNPPDISLVNADNDAVGVTLSADVSGLSVVEGHTVAYTAVLDSQPASDVTVTVESSDTVQGGTLSTASMTFTPANFSTPQSVTITGIDDLVQDGDTSWAITNTISSSDATYGSLTPIVVLMTTLDNEPGLTLPSGDVFYGVGTAPVGIDGGALISDPNADSYNGAALTVETTSGGTAADQIAIRNVGTDVGQISVSGSIVSYGGVAIGSFSGGTGTTPLVVTFNGAATPAAAQALLRNVTFSNTSSSPSLAARTVSITLTHADTASATATTTVRVGPFRLADFQEGADHGYGVYTGEADIEIFENFADIAYPAGHSGSTNDPRMWIDGRHPLTTEEAQVLMRFDNIIGTEPGQVPPGATVVSAELLLTVIDAGDGSPLFRMLRSWSETGESWLSFNGLGIQPNGTDARDTFESQIGVKEVTGGSGTGQITVGVTADLQAWVDGETNYGWGMVSWDADLNSDWSAGTDGMAFRPSEAPIISERPRLRVIWVPAGTTVARFRQNVDAYTSAHDTRIRADLPDSSDTTAAIVAVDFDGPNEVLVRFDDIIGTNPGQVPPGSVINAAFLDLATLGGNAYGDGGQFFRMLTTWQDTDTWNTIGGGIQPGVQAAATATTFAGSASRDPNVCGGYMSFDVTADAQAWANGSPNYGWAFLPWDGGGDGWNVATSENAEERARPRLRVFYTPGVPQIVIKSVVPTPTSVTINFGGEVGTTYSVQRSGDVAGTYTIIGTATVEADGTATFIDNSPLTDAAFYRISNP